MISFECLYNNFKRILIQFKKTIKKTKQKATLLYKYAYNSDKNPF